MNVFAALSKPFTSQQVIEIVERGIAERSASAGRRAKETGHE
jgi:FixJ family two-component response regulator